MLKNETKVGGIGIGINLSSKVKYCVIISTYGVPVRRGYFLQYRVFQLFYYFFTVSFLLENTYFNMKILEMLKMYLTANTRHRVQNPHYKNTLNILKTRDAPRPRQSDRDTASDDCTFLFSLLYFQLFFLLLKCSN